MVSAVSSFRALTARPFTNDDSYTEFDPSDALRPWIRCFWGSTRPVAESGGSDEPGLVTPDACTDIIFRFDHGSGACTCTLCGINDGYSVFPPGSPTGAPTTFAIRFHAWAVPFFTRVPLIGLLNHVGEADEWFPGISSDLSGALFDAHGIHDRIALAERYLLARLDPGSVQADVMNALHLMILERGTARIRDLERYTGSGSRRLERLFKGRIGVSPKAMSGLVRYQLLWRDMLSDSGFDVHDLVLKYGYTDQSHLIRDFKGYHSLTPGQARDVALGKRGLSDFYNTRDGKGSILVSSSQGGR